MLVLTSYYSEVRQHLRGGKRHGHHVDRHLSSLTQHGGKTQTSACVCVCILYVQSAVCAPIPYSFSCVGEHDGCPREKSVCSRRSDLTADTMQKRWRGHFWCTAEGESLAWCFLLSQYRSEQLERKYKPAEVYFRAKHAAILGL